MKHWPTIDDIIKKHGLKPVPVEADWEAMDRYMEQVAREARRNSAEAIRKASELVLTD